MASGVQGDAIPLMGLKAPPEKLLCPKRRRCEGLAFTFGLILVKFRSIQEDISLNNSLFGK